MSFTDQHSGDRKLSIYDGAFNRARYLTGSGPLDIYTFPGIVFVLAIYSFPDVFVFAVAALDLSSTEMEDAASILGVGRVRTILRITLPLILPAILAASMLVYLEAISI